MYVGKQNNTSLLSYGNSLIMETLACSSVFEVIEIHILESDPTYINI